MGAKLTTDDFINRAKIVHGETYDYSLSQYTGIMKKIIIVCSKHGSFLQTPNDHLQGYGCSICGHERTRESFLNKHGVTSAFALRSTIDKRKQTWMDKYGVDNPIKTEAVKAKRKQTWMDKYGVDNPAKDPAVQDKREATCIEKYGVVHNSHDPAIFAKQQKRSIKKFTLPSGTVVFIQGYEGRVIQQLLEQGYTEDDLVLTNRPTFKYFWSNNDGYGDDNWHVYHPDIVIPKERRVIEVKSRWTYDRKGTDLKMLSQNLAKHRGCELLEWKHEFIIFE